MNPIEASQIAHERNLLFHVPKFKTPKTFEKKVATPIIIISLLTLTTNCRLKVCQEFYAIFTQKLLDSKVVQTGNLDREFKQIPCQALL
jgi:hypothetical protein